MVVSIKIIVFFSLPNHTDFILHAKFRSAIKSFFRLFYYIQLYSITKRFHFSVCSCCFYSVVFVCMFVCVWCSFAATSFIICFHSHVKTMGNREKKRRAKGKTKKSHTHTCTKSGLAIDRIALNHCQCQ